ncbi:MAG: glutaminyl-peptide cyclotransferase [Candidatus Bathyarchaeota archaeon]|nr:glutaminyl-peptide cyclotransferase [Candidatus Bathyarchaeota archaeon]
MRQQKIVAFLLCAIILAIVAVTFVLLSKTPANNVLLSYTYKVVKIYPHDQNAFTQGLAIEKGFLYEGTGLWGSSSLRRVDLETGKILQMRSLPYEFFGEGITIFGNKIIQLTWQNQIGFVYDKQTFELLQNFSYPTEGWGITYDGKHLIMSDGTANLYFIDPETFHRVGQVEVRDGNMSVQRLNELEFVKGDVYANVWGEEKIAIINPKTGQVKGWIDLTGICPQAKQNPNSVLNGIAYDEETDRLFVTGKLWPQLFEIKIRQK